MQVFVVNAPEGLKSEGHPVDDGGGDHLHRSMSAGSSSSAYAGHHHSSLPPSASTSPLHLHAPPLSPMISASAAASSHHGHLGHTASSAQHHHHGLSPLPSGQTDHSKKHGAFAGSPSHPNLYHAMQQARGPMAGAGSSTYARLSAAHGSTVASAHDPHHAAGGGGGNGQLLSSPLHHHLDPLSSPPPSQLHSSSLGAPGGVGGPSHGSSRVNSPAILRHYAHYAHSPLHAHSPYRGSSATVGGVIGQTSSPFPAGSGGAVPPASTLLHAHHGLSGSGAAAAASPPPHDADFFMNIHENEGLSDLYANAAGPNLNASGAAASASGTGSATVGTGSMSAPLVSQWPEEDDNIFNHVEDAE